MKAQFKKPIIISSLLLISFAVLSQDVFRFDGKTLVLSNKTISRKIEIRNDSVLSTGLFLNGLNLNYITNGSAEFKFILDGKTVSSLSGWTVTGVEPVSADFKGSGAVINLKSTGVAKGLEISITYLMYEDLPLIRKYISFTNRSGSDIKLEGVDSEALILNFDYVSTWVYHNYARMKHLGPYTGNWDDPVVVIHNTTLRSGIALGNEAPGVLKRTVFHTTNRNAEVGMTHPEQDFPFRKC